MTFADFTKHSMIEYASIYPTMGTYLDHLFGVIGNGLEWADGCLTDGTDTVKLAALPAMERAACVETVDDLTSVPQWLKYSLHVRYEEIRPLSVRMSDPTIKSLYGLSDYSNICHIPFNIKQDWFNAAYTFLLLVQNTPIEQTSAYKMSRTDQERNYHAVNAFLATQRIATDIKADLEERFPQFVSEYVTVVGNIPLDPNRQDITDAKTWPLDRSTVELPELIQGFKDAISFCYRLDPRPNTADNTLDHILLQAAEAAVLLGKQDINESVQRDARYRIPAPPLAAIINKYKDLGPTPNFDGLVEPFCKKIKKAYRMRRINLNKNVPYHGYPLGRRAHCLEPIEEFTAANLHYNEHEQGRNPLRTIVGKLFSVVSENGNREIVNEFIQACKGLPLDSSF